MIRLRMSAPTPLLAPKSIPAAGSEREALHSLIRRTCEKNQLTVNDVLSGLILPQAGVASDRLTKMNYQVHLINRGCSISSRLISQVCRLVNISELSSHTLRELDELRGVGSIAISKTRKWCPECFNSDILTSYGPYDRLLWCLDDVHICPIHKVQLVKTCPTCGNGPFPVLTGRDVSGHCPKCHSWLGGRSMILEESRDEHTQFLFWQAKTYANLLDHPLPIQLDAGQGFIDVLHALAKRHFDGNFAALSRSVERNKSVLCTWLKGRGLPRWDALVEISYAFQIPLPEMLLGQCEGISISEIRRLPLASITRLTHPRKLPQQRNIEEIRAFLAKVEAGEFPWLHSIGKVAERLNTAPRHLRRILPPEVAQLSAILANRRNQSKIRRREDRERLLRQEVPQAVLKILNSDRQATRRAINRSLSEAGISVMHREGPLIKELVRRTLDSMIVNKDSGIN